MIELYERESCPSCARVRRALENYNIRYVAVPVLKLGSERTETLALPGVQSAEVPVLVDGDRVIQGSDAILEYVEQLHAPKAYGDPRYGLTRRLSGLEFSQAVDAVKAALATEGFGVLTEIDVQATLKKKLDVDFRRYLILGACNPPLAHQALTAEPGLGLLLPCNVVVTEDDDGSVVVSAVDPVQMFKVVEQSSLEPVAKEVKAKLSRALAAVA
jgi:uncharacterized protein (DUF302 family)/glutaredoxin